MDKVYVERRNKVHAPDFCLRCLEPMMYCTYSTETEEIYEWWCATCFPRCPNCGVEDHSIEFRDPNSFMGTAVCCGCGHVFEDELTKPALD